ncbi:hypothetical protein D9M68_771630 [compost metagenome]
MGVGQDARGQRVRRGDDAVAKAQGRQFLAQARLETGPGAEQRQTGFDFQQQGAWVAQADLRAEAIAPGREELLPAFDLIGIVLDQGEVVGQRMGRDQRLPGAQAERTGRRVDRLQHAALRRTGDQRQRRVGIAATTQHAIQCQLRQHYTGPAHAYLTAPSQAGWRQTEASHRGT